MSVSSFLPYLFTRPDILKVRQYFFVGIYVDRNGALKTFCLSKAIDPTCVANPFKIFESAIIEQKRVLYKNNVDEKKHVLVNAITRCHAVLGLSRTCTDIEHVVNDLRT